MNAWMTNHLAKTTSFVSTTRDLTRAWIVTLHVTGVLGMDQTCVTSVLLGTCSRTTSALIPRARMCTPTWLGTWRTSVSQSPPALSSRTTLCWPVASVSVSPSTSQFLSISSALSRSPPRTCYPHFSKVNIKYTFSLYAKFCTKPNLISYIKIKTNVSL